VELAGFKVMKSIYESKNLPVLGRLFLAYDDPALFRLGWREGMCKDFSEVYKCIKKVFPTYVRAAGLQLLQNCHSYMGQRRECVAYGKLRYDGHIMYYIEGGEVVIPRYIMAFGLRPESSKYFKYAQLVEPSYFTYVLYNRKHTIVARPSTTGIVYFVVSTNPDQAQTAVPELHPHVSEMAERDMSFSVQHGGVSLFKNLFLNH